MSMNDTLAAAMSKLMNCERIGKNTCIINPVSKTIKIVFDIMKKEGYIGDYNVTEDGKGGILEINLLGRINKCGVIKPRYPCKLDEYKKFEQRYLIAHNFGVLIVSTSQGMMTQHKAKEKSLGGRLVAYCY